MSSVMARFESELAKEKAPVFRVGDTVRVQVRVREGEKERLQAFEGVVIARHNAANRSTFTVRKVSSGVGVERVFPIFSPSVSKIQVMKRADVRRAKLYYLRERRGRSARLRERQEAMVAE